MVSFVWARRGPKEVAHLIHDWGSPCVQASVPTGAPIRIANGAGVKAPRKPFVHLTADELASDGLPFGRACRWCMKHLRGKPMSIQFARMALAKEVTPQQRKVMYLAQRQERADKLARE